MYTTTASPAAPVSRPNPLINRPFALLWAGQTISNLGDYIFTTTLALWIVTRLAYNQPWAPLAVSGVLVAVALPDLLVGPIAGVFVDRWDRRQTLLRMDALRMLLILLLALVSGLLPLPFVSGGGLPTTWQLGAIYGAVFLTSVCGQFFGPSRLALIGDIVPEEQRARATGLSQVTMSLAGIIGPPLAAPLFFALGAQWAILLNACSFLLSFLAILAVKTLPVLSIPGAEQQHSSFRREFMEGLRFFAGNRTLTTLLIAMVIIMLGAGALNALDIFFLSQNLHASLHLYGFLDSGFGAGVLAGAIVAGLFAERVGIARTFSLGIMAVGLLIVVYARLTSFAPALVVLFLAGMPIAAVNVVVGPLVLQATPRRLVGRVSSVLQPAIGLASMLSIALAGYLDSRLLDGFHAQFLGTNWGPVDTIFTATGLLILAGGLYAHTNLRESPGTNVAGITPAPAAPASQV